jgi:hypothetical protein
MGRFVEDPWERTIKLIDPNTVLDNVVQKFAGSRSFTEN